MHPTCGPMQFSRLCEIYADDTPQEVARKWNTMLLFGAEVDAPDLETFQ